MGATFVGASLWRVAFGARPDWRRAGRLGVATAGLHALILAVAALAPPGNDQFVALVRWLATGLPLPLAVLLVLRPGVSPTRLLAALLWVLGFPSLLVVLMEISSAPAMGVVAMLVPILPVGFAILVARRAAGLRWARLVGFVLVATAVRFGLTSVNIDQVWAPGLLFWLEWLMLWPLLRLLRPDLVAPSDGLWRRCLAFLPCWIGLPITAGWALGPIPLVALPVAGWIAARHGPRALPAIAISLLPMAIGGRGEVWGVPLTLGGDLGTALAAMLVAAFVADRGFREACLSATRLTRWQMAALAVLPFGFGGPTVADFQFVFHAQVLVLTVAALIGLSQVPLRAPLLVLCGSGLFGAAVALTTGLPREAGFAVTHALRSLPGDLVSILLALALLRLLRVVPPLGLTEGFGTWRAAALPGPQEVTHPGAWLLGLLNGWPALMLLLATLCAFGVTLTLRGSLLDLFPSTTTLRPFLPVQILMLVLVVAAATAVRYRWLMLPGRVRVSPSVAGLATVVMALALLPDIQVELGPLEVGVGGLTPGAFLGGVAAVWAFHRMGLGLPALLATAPPPAPGLVHPVFARWPLLIGLGCAVAALVGLFALVAIFGWWIATELGDLRFGFGAAPPLDTVPASLPPPQGAAIPRN